MRYLVSFFVLFLAAQPTLSQDGSLGRPVPYELLEGSTYQEGCFPPCLCPILVPVPLQGKFVIEQLPILAPFDGYSLTGIEWFVSALDKRLVGEGFYRRIGDTQSLALDLQIDEAADQPFHSGETDGGLRFPVVDITVTMNDYVCFDTVLRIVAAPARPTPVLWVEPGRLHWRSPEDARGWDVVSGDLHELRRGAGDFTRATEMCLADDHGSDAVAYDLEVARHEAVWFLVRDAGQNGSYDTYAGSQLGSRDLEIAASPHACPYSR